MADPTADLERLRAIARQHAVACDHLQPVCCEMCLDAAVVAAARTDGDDGPRWRDKPSVPGLYAFTARGLDGWVYRPAEFNMVTDLGAWTGLKGLWYGPIPPAPPRTT